MSMEKHSTPLVLAFTPDYFVAAATLLFSVLKHSKPQDKFKVICLLTEALPEAMQDELALLGGGRLEFSYINLEGQLPDIYIDPKYTVAASFRLLLPDLLPAYDKVIYLDCDMVVRNDLASLYEETVMDDYYLAGVYEATLDFQLAHLEAIGCTAGTYINSGFLIMNLMQLRKDDMVNKFITAAKSEKLEFPDQDVLNQLCKGRIIGLAPFHNGIRTFLLPQYKTAFLRYYKERDWLAVQAHGNIHYTGGKPWNTFTVKFDVWWQYYEKLPLTIRKRAFASKKAKRLRQVSRTNAGRLLINGMQHAYRRMLPTPVYKPGFEAIEVLRFPLMILVVLIHVLPFELQPIKLAWAADAVFTIVSELISHHLGRIAVPCFFLFSGYFFFFKIQTFNGTFYSKQLSRRWRSLLLPYLLWNMLFVVAVLLKNFLMLEMGGVADELYDQLQNRSWYDILWKGPFLFPLWYLRDLICMTILSPVFYLLFTYIRWFGLLLLLAAYLMVWELNVPGLSTTAIMFYGTGAFLGMYGYDLLLLVSKYKALQLFTSLALLGTAAYFSLTPAYEYWIRFFTLSGLVCTLSLGNLLCKSTLLKNSLLSLSDTVFFIYALHTIYIINWLKGGFARSAVFSAGWGKLAAYLIIPVACLLVCFCLYKFMKRCFPQLLAVLTGGRIFTRPIENVYGS